MKQFRNYSLVILGVAAFGLSACETIDGAGQDIERAGEVVQDAAN